MRFLKKIPIHPTTYFVLLFFILTGGFLELCTFAIVLFFHEFGHYFIAKKLGYTLEKFYIAPYGACLDYKEKQFERKDEICIAFAGPFVNIVFSLFLIALWWIFPSIYPFTKMFVEQNLMLAVFNLLPVFPLDGGRMFVAIFSDKLGRNRAFKLVSRLNIIFSILFLFFFILSFFISFNPTFAFATVFLMSGFIQGEYASTYKNSFLFEKKISNFAKPKILLANDDLCFNDLLKKIDRDTYTIFDIISHKGELVSLTEEQVVEICVKYDGKNKLSKLFDD